MSVEKEEFVFVVCGSKEHIDTLHFSLNYLKSYTKRKVSVITDPERNEVPIKHPNLIKVKTPKEYNNHQASIYLKTSLHRYLSKQKTYCYLDSDVIAMHSDCDLIFEEFISPIRFAPDHCVLPKFSPYAVNCGCISRCAEDRERFFKSLEVHEKQNKGVKDYLKQQRLKIEETYHQIQQSFLKKIFYAFKYYLSFPRFWLNNEFYFDKRKRYWVNRSGEVVKHELDVKSIARDANLKYTLWFNQWKNKKGENIFQYDCNHLVEAIKTTFEIDVKNPNWQHWNGGVFLFNDESHEFLESWHRKTVEIFTQDKWNTRDQGTLVATVWEFGLESHPTLSKEWNFIADFHNNKLALNKAANCISDDLFNTSYEPKFLHVFHEWENQDWEVWQWVISKSRVRETLVK